LAAVGPGSYLSWLFFVIVSLFSMSVLIYVAQAYDAEKLKEARKGTGESTIFSLLVTSFVTLAVLPFIHPIMSLLGGSDREVIDLGSAYFTVRILGLSVVAVSMVMDSAVRSPGATRLSMIATLSSASLNAVLDPFLIFGLIGLPKLGIIGVALATVISITYGVLLEAYFLMRLHLTPIFSKSPRASRKIIKLGDPAAFERLVFAVGNNIYIAYIARCGAVALAAH